MKPDRLNALTDGVVMRFATPRRVRTRFPLDCSGSTAVSTACTPR